MNQNQISLSSVLKMSGFVIAAVGCIAHIIKASQSEKNLKDFKKQQLKDVDDILKMKKGDVIYAKVKLENNQTNIKTNTRVIKAPIRYNQLYLQQPSDLVVIHDLYREQALNPIFGNKPWSFLDKNNKRITLLGFDQIVGDVFNIHRHYEQFQNGFLKRFWGGICFGFQWLFDCVRKRSYSDYTTHHIPIYRRPLIEGPTMGILHYTVGILTDMYFVVKVMFDGEFHQAVVLAESRNALLGQYEFQLSTAKVGIFIFGAIASALGYSLYKQFKNSTLIKGIIHDMERRGSRKKWLQSEEVGEDKLCIICYTNCRNLLFFDCKHLIMCRTCWKTMNQPQCPICKKEITTGKVIYVDEKQKADEAVDQRQVSEDD